MKTFNLLFVLSAFFLWVSFSKASARPDEFTGAKAALLRRQDGGSSASGSASGSQSASASDSQGSASTISVSASQSGETSATGSASGSGSTITDSASGSASGSGSASSNATTTQTAVDPRLPPGAVQMITPAATAVETFLKVGNQITFAWNYTGLSIPPSYIDVVATNTVNSQTYTIAANQSFSPTQTVVWDTSNTTANTVPFVVATYTLMIWDAASEPTIAAAAGQLGAFSGSQFGVYTPQPYTPLNEFRCATCSGAISIHEKQALGVLLGTCLITILSFTWFASGFGLFSLF